MNLKKEIDEALERVYARIDSMFRGARIATGKHVAKVKRRLFPEDYGLASWSRIYRNGVHVADLETASCGDLAKAVVFGKPQIVTTEIILTGEKHEH